MNEPDPGIELRVAGELLLKSRHADQHHPDAALVEDGPHLLQASHLQAVGFVDQDQGRGIGLGEQPIAHGVVERPPGVLPPGHFVGRTRRVHQDGIRFSGLRYIDPTLAAYVGEEVVLRYDPRDVAEIRIFHRDRFLCRAVCQELAGSTVPLREIVSARNRRRRELRQTLIDRRQVVDSLLEAKRWDAGEKIPAAELPQSVPSAVKLRRYACDE